MNPVPLWPPMLFRTLEDALSGDSFWYVKYGKRWFGVKPETAASMASDHQVVLTDDPEFLTFEGQIHLLTPPVR